MLSSVLPLFLLVSVLGLALILLRGASLIHLAAAHRFAALIHESSMLSFQGHGHGVEFLGEIFEFIAFAYSHATVVFALENGISKALYGHQRAMVFVGDAEDDGEQNENIKSEECCELVDVLIEDIVSFDLPTGAGVRDTEDLHDVIVLRLESVKEKPAC